MEYKNIIVEKVEGIATITFNRPEAMNALNIQTRAEFGNALDDAAADDRIKVLIVATGNGKAFVAGADIKEFAKTTPFDAHNIKRLGALVDNLENR